MSKKQGHEFHMVPMSTSSSNGDVMPSKSTMRQRGLLDSTHVYNNIINASNLPFQFSTTTKHWRWWNYASVFTTTLTIIEIIFLIVNVILLAFTSEPVTFNIRKYPQIRYQPLDTTTPINLAADSTVYHVTKEFGPATMGGMGSVLTALTQAQLHTGKITPYVVLPFYSFLKNQEQYPIKKTVDLVITVRNSKGEPETVEFKVSELNYDFNPIENFETLTAEEKLTSLGNKKTIKVYLIGPGKTDPFHKAFHSESIIEIYSSPKRLPPQWKDQYFDKAVASFLIWKATGKHEQSLFAPLEMAQPRVDVVHLHGATNAYVAKYLNEFKKQLGPTPPAVIYTMHDYLDELQYTHALANVEKFLNTPYNGRTLNEEISHVLTPYTFGKSRVFMSPMGIDMADVVTFVSRSMAEDIIEGRLDFYLKEVIMDNLLRKAEMGQFFGVSNGLEFDGSVNPFTEIKLIEHKLNYPSYAKTLIDLKLERGDTTIVLSTQPMDLVTSSKRRAKQYLVDQGLLRPNDIDRPLVLFVGRFQFNKGLETFEEAARLFKLHDMKFAIIGQPNNYPLKWVHNLAADHPENIVLMTHTSEQKQWLIYFRAAADFVYVPSITESFGLVAAEGLMFGSSVISTGTGGLGEFLVDRRLDDTTPAQVVSESGYHFNAYLFDSLARSGNNQLTEAIRRAAMDYEHITRVPGLHEDYVLRMMMYAYALGWNRGNDQGPVYDYLRIYQKAIQEKRASSSFNLDGDKKTN